MDNEILNVEEVMEEATPEEVTPEVVLPTDEIKTKSGVEEFINKNPQLASAVSNLQANNISLDAVIDSDPELKQALNYLANNNVTLNDVIEIPSDGEPDTESDDLSGLDVLTVEDSSVDVLDFNDIKEDNESTSTAELNELF